MQINTEIQPCNNKIQRAGAGKGGGRDCDRNTQGKKENIYFYKTDRNGKNRRASEERREKRMRTLGI